MLKHAVSLQENHECFYFIADLHALTEVRDPETLRHHVLAAMTDLLAIGIDPQRATLFLQSDVPAHTELMWLLTTLTPVGDLNRMTQYKDKAKTAKDFVNAGLLFYPILMAADILLYRAEGVPVGEDQRQHLELTRRIARRFNDRFGMLFPEPKMLMADFGARIMSLSNPKAKMSKSHGPEATLGIFDEPDVILKKIKRAVTDSGKTVTYDPKRKPALANLLTIAALLTNETPNNVAKRFEGVGYAAFKASLAELLVETFAPFRERRKALLESPSHVRIIFEEGAARARAIASETLREAKRLVGIA